MSASARRDLVGGRRVAVQVPLGQPDAADVDRAGRPHAGGVAEHELGRAAADVDDQERRPRRRAAVRRGRGVERGGGAEEGQLRLLAAGDRRPAAGRGWPRTIVLEVGAVGGVAGGAGGDHPDRRSRRGRARLAAYSASTTRVRSIASGASRPVASTPWPSRTTSMRRSRSVCAPRSAGRRRPAGGWSWCRSRSRRPGVTGRPPGRGCAHGPAAHHSPISSTARSPIGLTPGRRPARARPARAGT